jgi:hypothetical protein
MIASLLARYRSYHAAAGLVAVECNRPDAAAVAAGPRDRSRAVDDARCLQSGVERDPQQAVRRARYPLRLSLKVVRWPSALAVGALLVAGRS